MVAEGKGMIKREEEKLESLIKNSLLPPFLRLFNLLWMFGRVFLNPCDQVGPDNREYTLKIIDL